MKHSKVFIMGCFVFCTIILNCTAAPFTEDDEYDDDPELSDRKEMQKLQAELMEVVQQGQENSKEPIVIPTTSTEGPRKRKPFNGHRLKKKWVHAKEVRGYQILSDGPQVIAEMIKVRPMLRFKIQIPDTVRDVEKATSGRQLELKIRNWNKVHKVHIKVPFGYQPEDLKITELRDHIEVIAPIYSDVDESEK